MMASLYTTTTVPEVSSMTQANVEQKAMAALNYIKNGLSESGLFLQCLSLNSSATERCKTHAKSKSLFCTVHCEGGVIASPELKLAFETGSALIQPYVTTEAVPGGVFENKTTKDQVKVKNSSTLKLAHKVEANKCKKKNNQPCTTPTRNADGYCHHHRAQAPKEEKLEETDEMAEEVPTVTVIKSRGKRSKK